MRSKILLHTLTAMCVAVPMAADAATAIKSTSGLIAGDGSRRLGHGFTSQRLGAGDYLLTFSAGAFPTTGPAFTCSPAGIEHNAEICDVWLTDWHTQSPTTVEIHLYSNQDGTMEDNSFFFTELTTR